MIVLIHNDMELWDFMTEGLKLRDDVYDIPLNRYCSIINRLFRKYFRNNHLPATAVFGNHLLKILKGLKSGDKVVVCDYSQACLFYAIKKLTLPEVKLSLWLWNPIKNGRELISDIKLLKTLGVKCSTFDSEDAKTFNLNHLNTFYNMNVPRDLDDDHEIKYDFYFLGVPKDRGDIIKQMQDNLSSYNNLFVVPLHPSQYITYSENIRNIKSARCLVDITQQQQYDITLRPLEALAYERKLITNNVNIKEYPFYRSNNIFIWGVDNLETLCEFLSTPYDNSVESDIRRMFDVNYWLDRV